MLNNFVSRPEPSEEIMRRIVRKYSIPVDSGSTNEKVISDIYQYIGKHYRNEYYYKNTLLNKLIINVHRINTTTALTEVPIAKSKADFVMINGKAVVYEIKTELDTFDRLFSQINDYYKAFDHVCVVTSEAQLQALQDKLGTSHVGIYVLTKKNTIRRIREPQEYRGSLDSNYIFKILHKLEYEQIILSLNGKLPETTAVQHYQACKKILCELPIEQFYTLFLKELKKRNKISLANYESIPIALRFLLYFSKCRKCDSDKLEKFLLTQFNGG